MATKSKTFKMSLIVLHLVNINYLNEEKASRTLSKFKHKNSNVCQQYFNGRLEAKRSAARNLLGAQSAAKPAYRSDIASCVIKKYQIILI